MGAGPGPHIDRAVIAGDPRRALAVELLEAGLGAVAPAAATRRALDAWGEGGWAAALALGKAAGGMADGLARVPPRALAVVPEGAPWPSAAGWDVRVGDHPVPGDRSFARGHDVVSFARQVAAGGGRVLVLLSGGASALVERPAPGVTPRELARLTRALLAGGAAIDELNAVRVRLSRLKGGRLARRLAPRRASAGVDTVLVSDTPAHPPSLVASGPTTPPEPPPLDPVDGLRRRGLWRGCSPPARAALRRPPPAWPAWLRHRCRHVVAADGAAARRAVVAAGAARGLRLRDLPGHAAGEARALGAHLAREGARLADGHDGLVWGGETVVRVRGGGRGGRNQEVALGALVEGLGGALLAALATDGVDGATTSAGGLVDERLAPWRAEAARALDDNDADPFLAARGGRLATGPTGTNVADLVLWLR